MAISNYAELKAEVAAWLMRSDTSVTNRISSFVELATARFNAELRVPQMEVLVTTTVDGEWVELPEDFLGIRYIELSTGERMRYVTPEEYADAVAAETNPSPPIYTIADMSFRIYPTQTDTDVEVLYWKRIQDLEADGDTNWLLDEYPGAYLAASLAEGFDFLHDDARAAKWDARARAQIEAITRSGRGISQGASTLTIRVG